MQLVLAIGRNRKNKALKLCFISVLRIIMNQRLLIITNRIPYPLTDGGNLATDAMIKGYMQAGYRVYLLSMNTTRHPVADTQLASLYSNLAGFTAVPVDNDIKPVPALANFFFSRKPNHAVRFYHKAFAQKLSEVLMQFQPQVVQVESVFLSSYLQHIKKHSDALTVLRMHNIEYQIWQRLAAQTTGFFKKMYLNSLARRIKQYECEVWQEYDLLLPITTEDAAAVRKEQIKTPMVVAPFGIDVAHVPLSENEQWVGYHIGAMDWLPNAAAIHWFVDEVWPQLHQQMPSFEFYFAGRNMPSAFHQLSKDGIHCMGQVADANAFIADKKILIVPLQSGGGIRIKILEAMAAGKVVVATSVAIQGIAAIDGEHYLLANTATDFIRQLQWCVDNKETATRIGNNARELVQELYDRDKIMTQVVQKIAVVEKHM